MISVGRLLAVGLTTVALASCGGDEGEEAATSTPAGVATTTEEATTTVPDTTTAPPTTTKPTAPPGPPFGTRPTSAPGSSALALLTDVRLGRHEGYDRIVFEFRPRSRPGYRVRYVQPPIVEDASGRQIQVDGDAFLSIRMEPASGFDLTGDAGEVYTGPTRIPGSGAGTELVLEVVRTGDFEAVLSWVAGLAERTPFRVQRFAGPPRIVVDVRTG